MKAYTAVLRVVLGVWVPFTLVFLALEARAVANVMKKKCTVHTASTFLASNTSRGAKLLYKNSESSNIETVTFEGIYLSSTNACGLNYERCPNLTVIMDGNILVVVIPLQENFGVVTFNKIGDYFSFRQKHVVNISRLRLDCEVSSISEYFPTNNLQLTIIGKCLYRDTQMNRILLDSVYVVINSSELNESYFLEVVPGIFCEVHSPSEFVFLVSKTFTMGVSVFADSGNIWYQRDNEGCVQFSQLSVCANVLRFTSVPPDLQAIYCEATTYLLDLVPPPETPTFMKDSDGLPFFCSEDAYYTYKDGSLSFHHTTNRSQIGPAIPVMDKDVVWGECVNNIFVVLYLADEKVMSFTVDAGTLNSIGHSLTPPRIFGTSVLLKNRTHALVHDLQNNMLVDVIQQDFVMGYVVSSPDKQFMCTEQEQKLHSGKLVAAILVPIVLLVLVMILAVIFCYCCWRKKRSTVRRKKRSPVRKKRSCLGERKLSSSSENIGADSKLGELDKNKDQLSSTIYQESGQLGVNDDSTSALAQPSLTVGLSSTTTDPKRVPTHGDDLEVTFQASQEVDGAKRSNPGKLDTM